MNNRSAMSKSRFAIPMLCFTVSLSAFALEENSDGSLQADMEILNIEADAKVVVSEAEAATARLIKNMLAGVKSTDEESPELAEFDSKRPNLEVQSESAQLSKSSDQTGESLEALDATEEVADLRSEDITAEAPDQIEAPIQVVEEPLEVVEESLEIIEEPVEVVEESLEVVEEPAEVVEELVAEAPVNLKDTQSELEVVEPLAEDQDITMASAETRADASEAPVTSLDVEAAPINEAALEVEAYVEAYNAQTQELETDVPADEKLEDKIVEALETASDASTEPSYLAKEDAITTVSAQEETVEVEEVVDSEERSPTEESGMETSTYANSATVASSVNTHAKSCPSEFNSVEIPQNGKLCQMFAADFPASLVFYVPQTPQEVVQFYQDLQKYGQSKPVKDRFLMQSDDKNTTIIISADGAGAQVDVLVKSDTLG